MTVRTRIAPSPTGDPHVGTAYIALFNMVFAKQHGGQFLLRIEDTDQTRSTAESEQAILDSLRWLGLDWDEGPDVGGPHGPYRQSERMDIYAGYCQELIDKGHAFYCFASSEELDEMRKEQMANGQTPRYDGRGLLLSEDEVQAKLAAGEPYVVRMKIPAEGACVFNDLLRGEISIDYAQVDMQVLLKADGMPTYHLANVVDDHLMQITHVMRGEEWINSAPKHILLYQYFGWDVPVLCHLPLLRNPDKSKLSKRKNPTSINFYQRMGYLPEAVLNYLARMGWSMPNEEEKFSLAQMQENFDINKVSLGGPVFDVEKLDWLNGRWIREDLSEDQLAGRIATWALNEDYLKAILPLVGSRLEKLSDIGPLTQMFFMGLPTIEPQQFEFKKLSEEQVKQILQFVAWRLDAVREWNKDALYNELNTLAEQMELKLRDLMQPLFIALSGQATTPPLFDAMAVLGADLTRARVRHAVNVLGAPGKKALKKLEKAYQALSR
ncbi:glutamate--tRNA ligase [uncultured Umboniibacter sp.]|uniref:glutamate--tRNA ligase n=1 Tax=uncultured Umboniibacter sp. TaxID=1798917 RepID=UPI002626A5E7|nr:glutamate--tRNA ligase [uncultured Umboniibacter sp.]